ncbi:MAG: leucyl aminopeptidase [Pseudonocardiales bacterium]|nr:leucyl aminopeptidase [Pseudonocardiales bacterium]MBV9728621.1 leucyl aminopeptidase [Pseudonocardiales bacterium]
MTTPTLRLTDAAVTTATVDALVVGTMSSAESLRLLPGSEEVDAAFDGELTGLLTVLGARGKADEVIKVPTRGAISAPLLVATGLGTVDGQPTSEQVRRAAGAASRALSGTSHAITTLSRIDLGAAAEGSALGSYAFTAYRSQNDDGPLGQMDLSVPSARDAGARQDLTRAIAIAESVTAARDLVNTPPNDLYPASFADRAVTMAQAAGLRTEVLDEKALRREGYGGLLGVGGGSSRPPRLVRLHHAPAAPRAKVALVGKGITFDTGGISIKPAAKMEEMTMDMAGAAAVIVTTVLAARLELPVEVIATVPMAENMPSATAYRPGDVLTMYGGTTVEVLNTDAEGRLILADALVRAAQDAPDYLIDTATLTGAQIVALGSRTPGIMGTPEFRDRVTTISQEVGESGWAMPLPEHLRSDLDSKLADIANVASHRWGGMLAAGVFLSEFVPDDVPWAHLDIAGPAYNTDSPWGYTGKGGTGVPVRTLAAVLTDIAERG